MVFFEQSVLPAISADSGKILLEEPNRLMLAPNGNGALFDAVNRNPEVKAILEEVDYVQLIGVDNVLNRLLDPLFIGFVARHSLQAAMKCCVKRDAKECVGVIVKRRDDQGAKYNIVEYSELSEADATVIVPETGELKFNLGNILVFILQSSKLLSLS